MARNDSSRFIYHAQASAISGVFRKPVVENLDVQAMASLPVTGGYGSSKIEDFKFREYVRIRNAYSQVSGSQLAPGDNFDTMANVVVEGLDIMGVVTADRIVCRISSSHPDKDGTAPEITITGSSIVGLRVAGKPVQVWTVPGCMALDTTTSDASLKDYARSPKQTAFLPAFTIIDPGAKRPDGSPAPVQNQIDIPGFGTLYIGELIKTPISRRLTMLRLALGSPVDADLSVAEGEGDGHRFP